VNDDELPEDLGTPAPDRWWLRPMFLIATACTLGCAGVLVHGIGAIS
jgi:hypothetical protein